MVVEGSFGGWFDGLVDGSGVWGRTHKRQVRQGVGDVEAAAVVPSSATENAWFDADSGGFSNSFTHHTLDRGS